MQWCDGKMGSVGRAQTSGIRRHGRQFGPDPWIPQGSIVCDKLLFQSVKCQSQFFCLVVIHCVIGRCDQGDFV